MGAVCSKRVGAAFACLLLIGCAGYRRGWESVPYIGATAPTLAEYRTPFEAQKRAELVLPGVTLGVGINNQTRTSDTQLYLFALPLSVDLKDVQTQQVAPGTTRVTLRVVRTEGDFVFRPKLAKLIVAGNTVAGAQGFEFGKDGAWAYRPVADEVALSDGSRTYLLAIDFPVTTPPPKKPNIALDLSSALRAPGKPPIPLIRFVPTRWKEGYS